MEQFRPEQVNLKDKTVSDSIRLLEEKAEEFRKRPITELSFSKLMLFEQTGNRLVFEEDYFERRGRLAVFGILSWLFGRKEDIRALEDALWAVCNEFTWMLPAHMAPLEPGVDTVDVDLFAAETGQAIAEILALAGGLLSPLVASRCREEVLRRVLQPMLDESRGFRWEHMDNNWCAVCAGSVGMAACYLVDDGADFERIMERIRPVMTSFLSGFSGDGACMEGLSYWSYGMSYYIAFLDLYEKRTGRPFGTDQEKLAKMARFQSACYFADGHTVSFADGANNTRFRVGLAAKLWRDFGARMPRREFAKPACSDPCWRWSEALRDLVWFDGFGEAGDPEDAFLPEAQWAMLHGESCGVAVKGGTNAEPHNHNDVGSFLFYKNGVELIADLGCGEYTKEYFGPNRYGVLCNSAAGHGVPVIGGAFQREGAQFAADAFRMEGGEVTVSMAGAYGLPELSGLVRRVRLDRAEGALTVTDSFRFAGGAPRVTERLVTRLDASIDGNRVVLCADGQRCGEISVPAGASAAVTKMTHSEHDGRKTEVSIIDFTIGQPERETELCFTVR